MKRFSYYALGYILLIAAIFFYTQWDGLFDAEPEASNNLEESTFPENVEQIDDGQLVILSESFMNQVILRGYSFGEFTETTDFLDLIDISGLGAGARVEVLKNGQNYLTVFELKQSANFSYRDFLDLLQNSLGSAKLQPAAFGPGSFYFIANGVSTNLVSVKGSVLAFRFPEGDFPELKEFITLLLIMF